MSDSKRTRINDSLHVTEVGDADFALTVAAGGPVFERDTSPLGYSNDGRLKIVRTDRVGVRGGRAVVDTGDDHVEFFTMEQKVADALIAGYDYARHLDEKEAR